MCPVYGVQSVPTASGPGNPVGTGNQFGQRDQSNSGSSVAKLDTPSGGGNSVSADTRGVVGAQQAQLLSHADSSVAPEGVKPGNRRRSVPASCSSTETSRLASSVNALYASPLAGLQNATAALQSSFQSVFNAVSAITVPPSDATIASFNQTLANATNAFGEALDAAIGQYPSGAFNPMQSIFDTFLSSTSSMESLRKAGADTQTQMNALVDTWIAQQKTQFPGNDAAYDALADVIKNGRPGSKGIAGAVSDFDLAVVEKQSDVTAFFTRLTADDAQSSSVPQFKDAVESARQVQSLAELSSMQNLISAWNLNRQSVAASQPNAVSAAQVSLDAIPPLVAAANAQVSAVRVLGQSASSVVSANCEVVESQQLTCRTLDTQVQDFQTEKADLSSQEETWGKVALAMKIISGVLGFFTLMRTLSTVYDYIQETREKSTAVTHNPNAQDINRSVMEKIWRFLSGRRDDRAAAFFNPQAVAHRTLESMRPSHSIDSPTNLRKFINWIAACCGRRGEN